jgi:hypothetical protein
MSTTGALSTGSPAPRGPSLLAAIDAFLGQPELAASTRRSYAQTFAGLHRPGAAKMWHPTAALVIEILSPGDETWAKLPFYAAHQNGPLFNRLDSRAP